MPRKQAERSKQFYILLTICLLVAAGATVWGVRKFSSPVQEKSAASQQPEAVPIKNPTVIEYKEGESAETTRSLSDERKEALGISGGVDLVLNKDESLKIGDALVSMEEILGHIKLKRGEIVEDNLKEQALTNSRQTESGKGAGVYGIHVVKPGDNIWNIHFQFLRDYFEKRGVTLSPVSDEAGTGGVSSGVGRILKFSESMVYVYNVRERQLSVDLNLIQPLSKIVVFDMGRVFALLDQIDYSNVSHIQFDGETLWIPAKQ